MDDEMKMATVEDDLAKLTPGGLMLEDDTNSEGQQTEGENRNHHHNRNMESQEIELALV